MPIGKASHSPTIILFDNIASTNHQYLNMSSFSNRLLTVVFAIFLLILPVQTLIAQYSVNVLALPEYTTLWKEALTFMLMCALSADIIRSQKINEIFNQSQLKHKLSALFSIFWPLILLTLLSIWALFTSIVLNNMPLSITLLGFRFELWWLWLFALVFAWVKTRLYQQLPQQLSENNQRNNEKVSIESDSTLTLKKHSVWLFLYRTWFVSILFIPLFIGVFAISIPPSALQQLPAFLAKPSSTFFHSMRTSATLEILQTQPFHTAFGYGLAASGPAGKDEYYEPYKVSQFPLFKENEAIAYNNGLVGEDLLIPENWFLQTALNGGIFYAIGYLILVSIPLYQLKPWVYLLRKRGQHSTSQEHEHQNEELNSQPINNQQKSELTSIFNKKSAVILFRSALIGFGISAIITLLSLFLGQETVLSAFGFGKETTGFITQAPLSHVIDGGGWDSGLRLSGTFSTPNHFAAYLLLLLPVLVAGFRIDKAWRWLYALASSLSVVFIILSFSRFAWLGLALCVAGWLGAILFQKVLPSKVSLPPSFILFPLAFFAVIIGNLFLHVWENQTVALLWTAVWFISQIFYSSSHIPTEPVQDQPQ